MMAAFNDTDFDLDRKLFQAVQTGRLNENQLLQIIQANKKIQQNKVDAQRAMQEESYAQNAEALNIGTNKSLHPSERLKAVQRIFPEIKDEQTLQQASSTLKALARTYSDPKLSTEQKAKSAHLFQEDIGNQIMLRTASQGGRMGIAVTGSTQGSTPALRKGGPIPTSEALEAEAIENLRKRGILQTFSDEDKAQFTENTGVPDDRYSKLVADEGIRLLNQRATVPRTAADIDPFNTFSEPLQGPTPGRFYPRPPKPKMQTIAPETKIEELPMLRRKTVTNFSDPINIAQTGEANKLIDAENARRQKVNEANQRQADLAEQRQLSRERLTFEKQRSEQQQKQAKRTADIQEKQQAYAEKKLKYLYDKLEADAKKTKKHGGLSDGAILKHAYDIAKAFEAYDDPEERLTDTWKRFGQASLDLSTQDKVKLASALKAKIGAPPPIVLKAYSDAFPMETGKAEQIKAAAPGIPESPELKNLIQRQSGFETQQGEQGISVRTNARAIMMQAVGILSQNAEWANLSPEEKNKKAKALAYKMAQEAGLQ